MQKKDGVNNIGGQAVMEGVMMRGKKTCFMAVRKPDNTIAVVEEKTSAISEKYKILKAPVIRGVVAFIESMVLGMKTIMESAEIAGMESEDDKIPEYLFYLTAAVALVFSVGLFMLLPVWIGNMFNRALNAGTMLLGVIEGFVRIFLFLAYIVLISRMKDIQRVFAYHGAEHKTINCFEAGGELETEIIKKFTRVHKRCGTSFLLIVMIVSMIVFLFLRTDVIWLRFVSRILLIPVIAGVSYEIIKWAGRNTSALVTAVSYPGTALQKLTTKEPDDGQIEVAVAALKAVLEHEFTGGETVSGDSPGENMNGEPFTGDTPDNEPPGENAPGGELPGEETPDDEPHDA